MDDNTLRLIDEGRNERGIELQMTIRYRLIDEGRKETL